MFYPILNYFFYELFLTIPTALYCGAAPNAYFTFGFLLGESSSQSQSYASVSWGFLLGAAVWGLYPDALSGRVDWDVVIFDWSVKDIELEDFP